MNTLPEAIDQNSSINSESEFCDDGTGNIDNIDLRIFDDNIIGAANLADRAITWWEDPLVPVNDPSDLINPVPEVTPGGATDADGVDDGDLFYALIEDLTTGCLNIAQVEITVYPLPDANPISGPDDVCADAGTIVVYQVNDGLNPNSTYDWQITGDYVLEGGGDPTDRFVNLSFPNVGSANIVVQETSQDGCLGPTNSKTVTISDSPPALTFVTSGGKSPDEVCEFQTGVVFEVNNFASTVYNWTLPSGAAITNNPNLNSITVNFGDQPGTVSVTATSATGCSGAPVSKLVSVNGRPVLDPNLDNTVCSNENAQINFAVDGTSPVSANSYRIENIQVSPGLSAIVFNSTTPRTVPAGDIFNDVFENTTGGPLTVRYTVIPISGDNCPGNSEVINLTVDPEPILDNNLNNIVCSNEVAAITLAVETGSSIASGYNIIGITIPADITPGAGNLVTPGTIPLNNQANNILSNELFENTTGGLRTVEYEVVPVGNTAESCTGNSMMVQLTVQSQPFGSDITVAAECSDQ
ncbi:hypothetical protein E1176_01340, partial [Fulvivirga sp. RKSG066]|uniref:PKD-like domain-containing protein n=1 Tax=Fulvivirga aurantia TaxID=2529383 RepID=UPI001628A893|nr:hypothetical protein [Fulvivirga aurantia]